MSPSAQILEATDPASIRRAAAALRAGELVAMPTETVYGVAADATREHAVAQVYAVKSRPSFNPLIAHVANLAMAQQEGVFDTRAVALAERCWPGPLTLVLATRDSTSVCELARAGLSSIALRVPAHPAARALLGAVGRPVAAPSANRSGRLSPTSSAHVAQELGDALALILDGGDCPVGVESTIVASLPHTPLRILRPGAIDADQIEQITGERPQSSETPSSAGVIAPGQLVSHYAPKAQLRVNATAAQPHEVLLAFGPAAPPDAANLSPTGDTTEAAARLYGLLRQLDDTGASTIAVMAIPERGLGVAINDRLRRAAAPRPPAAED